MPTRLLRTALVRLGLVGWALLPSPSPADDDKPWAFQPVVRPDLPEVDGLGPQANPIDRLLAARQAEAGVVPAPRADRRTLIRRATFDLTGLPPTPEDVDAFLADDRPDAYDRLVDRLLASPHYGERWARHWLDLVRYAETHGYERDHPKPNAWRYRDWVVDALNRDLPYDRFVTEQLAGDELPDADARSKTATGFYRLGLIDDEPADKLMDRFDQYDDVVKVVGTSLLGLTVHCARCHDHKFDPIAQADYYRMVSFFAPMQPFVRDDLESISIALATPEESARHAARLAEIATAIEPLAAEVESIRAPKRREMVADRRRSLDNDTIAAIQTPAERRDDDQNQRVSAAGEAAKHPKPDEVDKALSDADRARVAALRQQIDGLEATEPPDLPLALGMTERAGKFEAIRLLDRGDAHKPTDVIEPGFLSALDPPAPAIVAPAGGATTGRRLALARWITGPDNPLAARVMVNRLWQHHFDRGIVGTPSDFGAMGDPPVDPELLDWLATEFVDRGWGLKAMHRLMMTSTAYQRSVAWDSEADATDPIGATAWRRVPRRLEAEAIRDAILGVSGDLRLEVGGPSVFPTIDEAVLAGQSRPGDGWKRSTPTDAARRSLYVHVKRTLPLPELEVLDSPDTADPCPQRAVTTTAPQALTLLNGRFLHDQAARFAERLAREVGDQPGPQVRRAFALALGRPPTDAEQADCLAFLDRQAALVLDRPRAEDRDQPRREALRALCLVLFNANEFVTVD